MKEAGCGLRSFDRARTRAAARILGVERGTIGALGVMNLIVWLPAMLALGLASMGLCLAFVAACDLI